MLFNSIEFILFLPVIFVLYWFVTAKHLQLQNCLLLAASYVFYGWWDWRFLALIFISSVTDFYCGYEIHRRKSKPQRRFFLYLSIVMNLGLLGFFKYFNFFINSWVDAFGLIGVDMHYSTWSIILPVGISFYTFQTLTYTIDIYRKQLEPTSSVITFFTFVAFFPQLVAGPIERARDMIPQLSSKRRFDYTQATDGVRQIVWGFFQKVVIADNLGAITDKYFEYPSSYSGITLAVAISAYSIQAYSDWAGYSNIAIGTAKLFGIRLSQNFNYPFFSRNMLEFWNRWHMTLFHWFRDYLFIPLGGSRVSPIRTRLNIMAIFFISGVWHGANWNYVLSLSFSGLVYLIIRELVNKDRSHSSENHSRLIPTISHIGGMFSVFFLFTVSMIPFRITNMASTFDFTVGLFDDSWFSGKHELYKLHIYGATLCFLIIEWFQRSREHALDIIYLPTWARWFTYLILGFVILKYGAFDQRPFVYFQF